MPLRTVLRVTLCASLCLVVRALPAHGQTAEELYNEGTTLSKAGKTDEAVAKLRQAVQLKPELAPAHFNLGIAYEKKGALDDAIVAYQEAVRCKPDAKYYQSLGLVYRKSKLLPAAIEAYKKAAAADPKNPNIFYNLGNAYLDKDALADAIANYEKALALRYPSPAAVHLNLGIAHQKQGADELAIKAYQAYLKAAPRAANAKQIQETIAGLQQE